MSSSYEDHLVRQLRAFAAALARVIGLRGAGQIEEARVALDRAYQFLLGDQYDLLRNVDAITAAQMIHFGDRIAAYARLVHEEAELADAPPAAAALRLRAMELSLEALLRGHDDDEFIRFARDLSKKIDASRLTPPHRKRLELLRCGA